MKLTPETLFGPVPLSGPVPSQMKLASSGDYGSYLRAADDDRERLELWLVETATCQTRRLISGVQETGANEETAEERAERERRRQFARGITAYAWHPTRNELLLAANGAAHLLRVAGDSVRRLTPPDTRQSGIRFSSLGNSISYVRDGDLYCLNIANAAETRLTTDGGGTVTNGLADFIAQEEMHRFDGHWWSPDETAIAFTRVDTASIPETYRHEIDADGIRVIPQRYPFAGGANADVRLGLLDMASGATRWLDWALDEDDYLVRVQFAPDGALTVQAQSRDQKRLALRRFENGQWRDVLTETSETWVNLHDNLTFLDDRRWLWTSERTGSSQLYLYDQDNRADLLSAGGATHVNRVLGATGDRVWFTGYLTDPTAQDVFCTELAKGYPTRRRDLTDGKAWQDAVVNAKRGLALVLRSALGDPATLQILRDEEPERGMPVLLMPERRQVPLTLSTGRVLDVGGETSIGTIDACGGALYYRLTKPSPFDPNRRYPLIVHVYGGPGVQRVRREFPPLSLQLFAQAGFGVFELDNRGSANRDRAFESAIHGRLGQVEVADQLEGVRFLRSLDWVDARRIGIFGHSYGGYMVLMCLAASHAFAAGVSVAPVTDWTLYDTHYTERYLGTPAANPQGYADSAVLPRVSDIDAPLLLMHGMADDNVLFTHSLRLIKALQDAGKAFELMTYPGSKHALQERSVAIHRYRLILDFFRRTLTRDRSG